MQPTSAWVIMPVMRSMFRSVVDAMPTLMLVHPVMLVHIAVVPIHITMVPTHITVMSVDIVTAVGVVNTT